MRNKNELLHDIFTIMQMLGNSSDIEIALLRAAEDVGFSNLPIKLLVAFEKHLESGE